MNPMKLREYLIIFIGMCWIDLSWRFTKRMAQISTNHNINNSTMMCIPSLNLSVEKWRNTTLIKYRNKTPPPPPHTTMLNHFKTTIYHHNACAERIQGIQCTQRPLLMHILVKMVCMETRLNLLKYLHQKLDWRQPYQTVFLMTYPLLMTNEKNWTVKGNTTISQIYLTVEENAFFLLFLLVRFFIENVVYWRRFVFFLARY